MMTFKTSRTTTTRTVAAAAAVAAASTLAACGSSDSKTASEVPSLSSSSSSSSSSAAPTTSSTAPSQAPKTSAPTTTQQQQKRASRSEDRKALAATPAVTTSEWSQVERVPAKTVYVYSSELPKGTSQVTQRGHSGTELVTYKTTKRGEKVVSSTAINTQVKKQAVRRIITVGTGQQAAAQQQQVSRSATRQSLTTQQSPKRAQTATTTKRASSASTSTASAGSGNAGMWQSIARCESGNNWHINTGNGFYGGLQFTQQTWAGYGGLAYAPRADLASPGQQMAIADKVLADVGRGAWPVCGR